MKRVISMLLVLMMALSLIACGASEPAAPEAPAAPADAPMQYKTPAEAKELLNNDAYVFFDIRKAADSSANSVPGAQAWDMDAAKEGDAEAGKATMTEATNGLDKEIVLVCYSGKRYAQAATNALSAIGYDMSKVWTLEGGFTAWSETYPELTTAYVAPAEPVELTIGIRKLLKPVGVNIALAKGFFAEEGIDAKLEIIDKPNDGYIAVETNTVDMYLNAFTPMGTHTAKNGIENLVVFGGSIAEGTEILGLAGAPKLEKIEDFVGKKFACLQTETGQLMLKAALVQAGYTINVDPENDTTAADVSFQIMKDNNAMNAAVKEGLVDYAITNAALGRKAEAQGLEISGLAADILGTTYPCCRQVTSKEVIAEKRDALVKYHVAQLRGYQFFLNNQDESAEILAAFVEQDPADIKTQMYGSEKYTPATVVNPDPQANESIAFLEAMVDGKMIPANEINWADYFDTSIYSEALQIMQDREPDEQLWKDMRAYFEQHN